MIQETITTTGRRKLTHDLALLRARVNCEKPNGNIYKFDGKIASAHIRDGEFLPLGPENVLLRGMVVRATEETYGLVIFTGQDTKVMKNTSRPVYKYSRLERTLNLSIVVVLCFQFCLALIGAAKGYAWLNNNLCTTDANECEGTWAPYLPKPELYDESEYWVMVATWILMMTNMVPVSLLVSLDLVKYIQAWVIESDRRMGGWGSA